MNQFYRMPISEGAGIYFLLHQKKVIYIGQSRNLLQRIGDHRKRAKIAFDDVYVLPLESGQLDVAEALFIRKLKPAMNVVQPNCDERLVSAFELGQLGFSSDIQEMTGVTLCPGYVGLYRSGGYWAARWRDSAGRQHGKGLGSIKKVSRRVANIRACRLEADLKCGIDPSHRRSAD